MFAQGLQVCSNQAVLHPILAHAAGLAIGDQFVWIEGHIEIKIVVDHELKGFAGQTIAFVLLNGFGLDLPLWPEAVSVDPAHLFQLFQKFGRQAPVMFFGNVSKGILQSHNGLLSVQSKTPVGCPANSFHKGRYIRQFTIRPDFHGVRNLHIDCHRLCLMVCDIILKWRISEASSTKWSGRQLGSFRDFSLMGVHSRIAGGPVQTRLEAFIGIMFQLMCLTMDVRIAISQLVAQIGFP